MAVTRVTTDGIADSAVNSAKIGVDVVTDADLASNSVTVNEISNNAVTADKIAANAVTNTKVANATLDLAAKVTGTLPVANGGTALTSGFRNGGMTVGSAQTLSSVASVTFDNIPSTAQQIRFLFHSVTPGSTELEIRVGHSGGWINTGVYYNHLSWMSHGNSPQVSYTAASTKFITTGWTNANNTYFGYYDIMKNTANSVNYVYQDSAFWNSGFNTYAPMTMAGFCNMGTNVLTKVLFMTGSGNNFTEGFITMTYI